MISFYRPTKKRFKILCEKKAFPSDQYALESQVNLHQLKAEDCIIEIGPRDGEETIRNEDIVQKIEEIGEELFDQWSANNLDEGEAYAEFMFMRFASDDLKQQYNEYYGYIEGDEFLLWC